MKLKKTVSIDDFDGKKYRLTFYEEDIVDNNKAVLTHYLHNIGTDTSKYFEKDAKLALKNYVDYVNDDREVEIVADDALQQLLFEATDVPFPTPDNHKFTFIDLFAGVGGFRIAMQNLGGKCVFSSEWDKSAQKTYQVNFGEVPFGDITKESVKAYIPEKFDVLCAGFPCQPFSIAGNRQGFSDTRGTLFFDIEQIVEKHKPKVLFLENVKNLVSHDKGKTFKVIVEILEKKLGYVVFHKVLNSMTHANVPQNRERIFIIAFDPKQVKGYKSFTWPKEVKLTNSIHDILETGVTDEKYFYDKNHKYYPELKESMTKTDTVYQWRRVYVRENKSNVCPTLTANMGTGGHNVPLIKDKAGIRKLTPKECFAFQGFPTDKYILPNIANSKLYMQAGNSVTVKLIEKISQEILKVL